MLGMSERCRISFRGGANMQMPIKSWPGLKQKPTGYVARCTSTIDDPKELWNGNHELKIKHHPKVDRRYNCNSGSVRRQLKTAICGNKCKR